MFSFDAPRFRTLLARSSEASFKQVLAEHPDLYCWGLFTAPDWGYVYPTSMSEAGLQQAVREYQRLGYKDPLEQLQRILRWNPPDSPWHLTSGNEHFEALQTVTSDLAEQLNSIDVSAGWDEFHDACMSIENAACETLEALDSAGLFGRGADRERLFIGIMMGDQDDSILRIGKRLNPPASFSRFVRDWSEAMGAPAELKKGPAL